MVELLTGVRLVECDEDNDQHHLVTKQSYTSKGVTSLSVAVVYHLIVSTGRAPTDNIVYISQFLRDLEKKTVDEQTLEKEHALRVRDHLPAYMRENCMYFRSTLLQFYTKLLLALRKSAETDAT